MSIFVYFSPYFKVSFFLHSYIYFLQVTNETKRNIVISLPKHRITISDKCMESIAESRTTKSSKGHISDRIALYSITGMNCICRS